MALQHRLTFTTRGQDWGEVENAAVALLAGYCGVADRQAHQTLRENTVRCDVSPAAAIVADDVEVAVTWRAEWEVLV